MKKYDYLLSGSLAYDSILMYDGKLENNILPESLARLNVSFAINNIEHQFGGTAGNIAYNSSLLNLNPLIFASLGKKDSHNYLEQLNKNNLDTKNINIIENELCSHAYILTDIQNNQITSFYDGSMKHLLNTNLLNENSPNLWHLSPENPINTALLAKRAIELNKEYFFDPGQCTPLFTQDITKDILSTKDIIKKSKGIFVNDYEYDLLANYFNNKNLQSILNENQFLVKTLGSKGVEIYTSSDKIFVPVFKADKIVDPTGCGDSFRAGFIYGYINNLSYEKCLELGSFMGSKAISCAGGQNHSVDFNDFLNIKNNTKKNNIKPK